MTQQEKFMNLLTEMGINFKYDKGRFGTGYVWWDAKCKDKISFIFDDKGNFLRQELYEL